MAVRVVKAYEAASDLVFVTRERKVDFPTDGNPTRAMRASPDLETSNPLPPPPPAPEQVPGVEHGDGQAYYEELVDYSLKIRREVFVVPLEQTKMVFCSQH